MISKLIFNIRIVFRVIVGSNFYLYKLVFNAKKNDRKLLISENTEVVIEGFPRVGNTFFVLSFQNLCMESLHIAHHVHLTCQIKQGLKKNLPIIVLIRDPIDSVLSLKIREPKIFIYVAFAWYYFFYRYVLKNKKLVYIKSFDAFTSDFSTIEVPNFNFKNTNDLQVEEIFEKIAEINKKDLNKATKNKLAISSPNNDKEKIKENLNKQFKRDAYLVRKCYKIYKELIY